MSSVISVSRLSYLLVLLYCLSSVLVPVFVLNKLLYVPLVLMSLWYALLRPVRTISPLLIFAVFLYGFLLSLVGDSDFSLSRQMLLGCTTLFFIYFIDRQHVDMTSVVKTVGVMFALLMCTISLLVMLAPNSALGGSLLSFYTKQELGFYGVRQFGALQMFMLHHRSSPFLLIPLAAFLTSFMSGRRRDSVWIILILTCIFFTASRALMLMAGLVLLILFLYRSSWVIRSIVLLTLVPIAGLGLGYLWVSTSMFSATETSNSIKIGHLLSFYDSMDFPMLLVGNGSGSYFFTSGYDRWVAQTEITWMDSIRFFGVPLTVVLLMSILFPARKLFFKGWEQVSALATILVYLVMSFSNPIIFNSFGFIAVLWYWSHVLLVEDKCCGKSVQEERACNE